MEAPELQLRYKILQTVYRGSKERNSESYRLIPDMLGCTYAEMNFQLRLMKSKGLLDYVPRMLMRHYTITILAPGKEIIDQFESAFFSEDADRDQKMKDALTPLK